LVRFWLVAVGIVALFLGLERNLFDCSVLVVRSGDERRLVVDSFALWIYLNGIISQPVATLMVFLWPGLRRLAGQPPR
jgi:hypothetical protein